MLFEKKKKVIVIILDLHILILKKGIFLLVRAMVKDKTACAKT